ncbi:MAG: DNA-binding protein [Propionibacteriales bacterium]|nr:DNA-binding protein [Propionibacteriales bacterium]
MSTPHDVVAEWLTLRGVADRLGVSPNKVRQMVRDHELAAVSHPDSDQPQVPAGFLDGDVVVRGLPGTLTLLADCGFDDAEAIRWLLTPDESLPGTPMDNIRSSRGREVRRRAQALAF